MGLPENNALESDRRLAPRLSVMLIGVVDSGTAACPARLTNVSETGAAVVASNLPPSGFWLEFRKAEMTVRGRIAWLKDGQAGVEFQQAVNPKALLRTISAPRAQPTYRPRRSPLDPKHLTRAEKAEFKWVADRLGLPS